MFLSTSIFFSNLHIFAKICKNPADLHRFAKIENLGKHLSKFEVIKTFLSAIEDCLSGAGIIPGHMTPQKCADSIVDSPGYRKKALEALKSAASTSALIDEDQSIDVSPSSVTPEKHVTPQGCSYTFHDFKF